MRGGVTDAGRWRRTVKIELLSRLKLEAEFHKIVEVPNAMSSDTDVRQFKDLTFPSIILSNAQVSVFVNTDSFQYRAEAGVGLDPKLVFS